MKILTFLLVSVLVASVFAGPMQETEQILEGILVGTFGDLGRRARGCMQDGELIFENLGTAVDSFEKAILNINREELVLAMQSVGQVLTVIPTAVRDCEQVPEVVKGLERIAAAFIAPEELIIDVGAKILWHGIAIYRDVNDCIKQFRNNQYEAAGEDIGNIIRLVFLNLRVTNKVDNRNEAVTGILEGFFDGAFREKSLGIANCIGETEVLATKVEKLYNDIKGNPLENIEPFIVNSAEIMPEISSSLMKCSISPNVMRSIDQFAERLRDTEEMKKMFYKALFKFPQIMMDRAADMVDGYNENDFVRSGKGYGDLLDRIINKVNRANLSLTSNADDAVNFTKAFYRSAFNLALQLDTCKDGAEATWNEVIKAVEGMKAGGLEALSNSIIALTQATPKLFESFKTCKEDWPQLKIGLDQLKVFVDHPTSILAAVTEGVTFNPIDFPRDAYNIYSAFHSAPANYDLGGSSTGDITRIVMNYMPHERVSQDVNQMIKVSE